MWDWEIGNLVAVPCSERYVACNALTAFQNELVAGFLEILHYGKVVVALAVVKSTHTQNAPFETWDREVTGECPPVNSEWYSHLLLWDTPPEASRPCAPSA